MMPARAPHQPPVRPRTTKPKGREPSGVRVEAQEADRSE
jgi:hypothetical protein